MCNSLGQTNYSVLLGPSGLGKWTLHWLDITHVAKSPPNKAKIQRPVLRGRVESALGVLLMAQRFPRELGQVARYAEETRQRIETSLACFNATESPSYVGGDIR
jgi:hypothetical protein